MHHEREDMPVLGDRPIQTLWVMSFSDGHQGWPDAVLTPVTVKSMKYRLAKYDSIGLSEESHHCQHPSSYLFLT